MKKWTAQYQQFYPEYCLITIEAKNLKEAEKKAKALLAKPEGINPEEDTAEGQPYEDWESDSKPDGCYLYSLEETEDET